MASTSSSHPQNDLSGLGLPYPRREVEGSCGVYDVFINHRGPDVKHTIAAQLYNSLHHLGIRVFLDSEEKELGALFTSTIENAIKSASVHIAIFSKRYAESAWCLSELVLMLHSKAKIIPVFYQVEPWELRYIGKGVYAQAFLKHEENRRYPHKLKEWKEAIEKISYIAGYELKSSDFVECKDIVSAVEGEVQRTSLLHVAKHPVGLHKLVEDFRSQCAIKKPTRNKVKFFGIYGKGGVGKTTLSLELFNKKRSNFTRASFLCDIRETYASGDLPLLQKQLLADIFREYKHNFVSVREGTRSVRDCFAKSSSLSFLIVLDDIDHVEQLEALLPVDILCNHGNHMIIITTREEEFRRTAKVDITYRLEGLGKEDGRELFCWYAFNQPFPERGSEDVVDGLVDLCGGLPLSLIIRGRHVSSIPLQDWMKESEKFETALPGDVKKNFAISFEALNYVEKQVFMDIACFLIGKPVTEAMSIWRGSGWEAVPALETLKRKCLVQEVELKHPPWLQRTTFRMHDHLRDLGRDLADEERYPHRLWRPRDLKILESEGLQNVLAQTKSRCFHTIVDKASSSRITYFIGGLDTSLLWLRIEYPRYQPIELPSYKNSNILSRINLQNLHCLIMIDACFRKLWQSDVQAPPNLKEIQITCGKKFRSLSAARNFCRLVEVRITECRDLGELRLEYMTCLQKIYIEGCDQLTRVSGINTLAKLVELKISNCDVLEFENLSLRGMMYLEMVTLDRYVKINSIELDGCKKLKRIDFDCKHIVNLSIYDCEELERLPDLRGPSCLERIEIDGCGKLINLRLNSLENLQSVSGKSEQVASLMERASCLKQIKVEYCVKLMDITLPATVKFLDVQSCGALQRVEVAHDYTKLTRLKIKQCPALHDLFGLDRLNFLENVAIESCESLHYILLPTIVIELDVQSCRELRLVAGAYNLTDIRRLSIKKCPSLVELPCLTSRSYFKTFVIECCENLKNVPGIEELNVSERMELHYCSNEVIWDCFCKLQSLPSLPTVLIGKASAGVESSLNEFLFSEGNVGMDGMMEIENEWRSAMVILMVVVDSSTPVEDINKSLSNYGIKVRQGEWMITIVADLGGYSYLQECEDALWSCGIVKNRFCAQVKTSEQWKSELAKRLCG